MPLSRTPERAVGRGRGAWGRRIRQMTAGALALAGGVVTATPAAADGPTTFTNAAPISIPAAGSPDQSGPASPYPSSVSVSGLTGATTRITVQLTGLTHDTVNDVDALLVAPTGATLVLLSDIGDPSTLTFATDATLTFDDAAAGPVPTGNIPTGTYKPTNTGGGDAFPAPAPTPGSQTTLAGAFNGINPNGTWQLYIVDDTTGDIGTMTGWSLTITTEVAAVATTTVITTSSTPSTTGAAVTFTATVTAAGNPLTTGSVQFSDGAVPLGGPVPLNASGQAALTTSALSEGTHVIVATFSGSTGFLTSNGSLTQRIDNATTVTGSTFCNTGPIGVPASGPAQPYPSNITVSGLTGTLSKVTAALNGVSHAVPVDLDILLAGPVPGTNLVLLSDAGGTSAVTGRNVVLDDAAAGLGAGTADQRHLPADRRRLRRCRPVPRACPHPHHGHRAGDLQRVRPQRNLEPVGHRRCHRRCRLDQRRLVRDAHHHGTDHHHRHRHPQPLDIRAAGHRDRHGGLGRCPRPRWDGDLHRWRFAGRRPGPPRRRRNRDPDHHRPHRRSTSDHRHLHRGSRIPGERGHPDPGGQPPPPRPRRSPRRSTPPPRVRA